MREIRLSGSEGGVALIAPSLPLSVGVSRCASGVPTTVYLEPVPGAGFGKSLSETLSKMAASRQSSRQIDELEMATKRHKRRRRIQFL